MRREFLSVVLALLGSATAAFALGGSNGVPTNATERLGQRLVDQSCIVCHGSIVEGAAPGAPALSKNTLGGDLTALQAIISEGTAAAGGRMPAWRYRFTPDEIGAIAMYIKTIPASTDAAPPLPVAR